MQVTTAGADTITVFNNYGYGLGRCAQALVHTLRRLNARGLNPIVTLFTTYEPLVEKRRLTP
jgi:hypothetical protein